MDLQPAARGPNESARLATGTRLGGGRYTVGARLRRGLFAELYEAVDATTGNGVSIHLLLPELARHQQLMERLLADSQRAAGLSHKNIAQVIELAVEGEHAYLATELVEGHSLRELLDRKRETGTVGFGAKGTLNIVTHVCNALAAAAPQIAHGALTLGAVAVSRAGRIRVTDFGLAAAVPLVARAGHAVPSLAPEVVAGGPASAAADVYGVGALLYEVLVGSPPIKGCTRPSEAVPGVPAAVDAVVGRAMNPAPERRFPDTAALRDALTQGLASAARSSDSHTARPSGSMRVAQGSGQGAAAQAPAAAGPAASLAKAAAQPSLAESLSRGRNSAQIAAMSAAFADHDEKWLISKGKLDYGPFSLAKVAQQVQSDQILPGHVIIDKDSGTRRKVEDHPLLGDLVFAAKERRDEQRRAHAEVQHASQEKRRGAALYAFIGLGVLALGGGAVFMVHKLSADKGGKSGAIEALEGGSLQAKISFPTRAEQQRRAHSHHGKRGGPGGASGGWDDSLNLDMSDDDDGTSERLTDDQVNPVIQRHGGALGHCLTSTGTHSANIEFIVKPTGQVQYVRVNGQTKSPVSNCVRGVMLKMQFPTFHGVRSKHYFDMNY